MKTKLLAFMLGLVAVGASSGAKAHDEDWSYCSQYNGHLYACNHAPNCVFNPQDGYCYYEAPEPPAPPAYCHQFNGYPNACDRTPGCIYDFRSGNCYSDWRPNSDDADAEP